MNSKPSMSSIVRKIALATLSLPLIFGPAAAPQAHAEDTSIVFAEYIGSEPYTDSSGVTYQPDVFSDYVGDTTSSGTTSPISGTTDDSLYQVTRTGTADTFSRAISLPNGDYTVTLKFSEFTKDAAGQRVFSVWLEGQKVVEDLDIFATVGANAAYDAANIPVTVAYDVLHITFTASVGTPSISAIVVSSASDDPASINKTALTAAIDAQYSDGSSRQTLALTGADYTAASWLTYSTAIQVAKTIEGGASSTQAEVNAATAQITTMRATLVFASQELLDAATAAANGLTASNYTATSWAAVTSALALPHDTNALTVAKANAITSAIADLEIATVDETSLTDLINAQYSDGASRSILALTEAQYTPESWAAYVSAVLSGKEIESNATSTQAEIDTAVSTITQARATLVLEDGPPDAATSAALESAVTAVAALQESRYTPASWAALTAALALPQVKKSEVIVKTASINCAIAQLVRLVAGMTFPLDITKSGNEASTTLSSALETATTTGPANLAITVTIPSGTVIRGSAAWNGVLTLPVATTTFVLVPTSGNTASVVQAIEIGAGDIPLTFDKPAKIVFAGQAGKLIGWSQANAFHQITAACPSSATSTSPTLSNGADCKIDVGPDLVVWTKHFSTFIAYTESATTPAPTNNTTNNSTSVSTSSGGGGGGGGGGRLQGGVVLVGEPIATTQSSTGASAEASASEAVSEQTLAVPAYTFSKNLFIGLRGADVTALQQFLVESGYPIAAGVTGYFGSQTRAAVIAYQRANGLPATGYVGQLTVALLNGNRTVAAGSALTSTQANSIVTLLQSFGADASVIERVQSVLGRITRAESDGVVTQAPVETDGGVTV